MVPHPFGDLSNNSKAPFSKLASGELHTVLGLSCARTRALWKLIVEPEIGSKPGGLQQLGLENEQGQGGSDQCQKVSAALSESEIEIQAVHTLLLGLGCELVMRSYRHLWGASATMIEV